MLIDFSVTNFRSFRDETTFDMLPAKSKTLGLDETNIANVKLANGQTPLPLLRTSAIYGANASGKSNFIRALAAMQSVVSADAGLDALEIFIEPFALSRKTIDKPTTFEITIIADDKVTYEYGFSATSNMIYKEWLYGYPNGRKKTYYERKLSNEKGATYEYVNRLQGDKKVWERTTTPQRLFLSNAIQLNCQELKPVHNWFTKKLWFMIGPNSISPNFTIEYCKEKESNREEVHDFLKNAVIEIEGIEIEKQDIPKEVIEILKRFASVEESVDPKGIPEEHEQVFLYHKTLENKTTKFELGKESHGTQKIFALAGPILWAIEKNHVLLIDELDNSLHPKLAEHIIRSFQRDKQTQLIFSTHDASLLNADDLLRRDQIWFCEKDDNAISDMFPLAAFKPRKDITNLERGYLAGRYGGIPFISDIC